MVKVPAGAPRGLFQPFVPGAKGPVEAGLLLVRIPARPAGHVGGGLPDRRHVALNDHLFAERVHAGFPHSSILVAATTVSCSRDNSQALRHDTRIRAGQSGLPTPGAGSVRTCAHAVSRMDRRRLTCPARKMMCALRPTTMGVRSAVGMFAERQTDSCRAGPLKIVLVLTEHRVSFNIKRPDIGTIERSDVGRTVTVCDARSAADPRTQPQQHSGRRSIRMPACRVQHRPLATVV
jgi:hypothetical protein